VQVPADAYYGAANGAGRGEFPDSATCGFHASSSGALGLIKKARRG